MKFFLELISKSNELIPAELKHTKNVEGLINIPKPWGLDNFEYPFPKFGKQISSNFQLNKFLKNGIKGEIIYSYVRDSAPSNDDRFNLDFNPQKIDYNYLIKNVFKSYINFFNPYQAQIFNEESVYYFFENRHKYDLSTYFQFYPVFFWNEEFCREKVNLSLTALKNKLEPEVEFVELFLEGIYVIASSKILTLEESNELDFRLKKLL